MSFPKSDIKNIFIMNKPLDSHIVYDMYVILN